MNSVRQLYLKHHGIKGQKWGVRRYQDEDGSLTPAGKRRSGAGKTVGLLLGGAAIGAVAIGSAWAIKNKINLRNQKVANLARIQKGLETKNQRRAMGLYNKIKSNYVDPKSGMIMNVKTTVQNLARITRPG